MARCNRGEAECRCNRGEAESRCRGEAAAVGEGDCRGERRPHRLAVALADRNGERAAAAADDDGDRRQGSGVEGWRRPMASSDGKRRRGPATVNGDCGVRGSSSCLAAARRGKK
ncbi:unnamed protein product [Linum trigynum]|uniref:Uncharacterized protein n=1 Tax=Linum trigynum TaxID=586398 RepID=A0AAV2DH42_9ROSI